MKLGTIGCCLDNSDQMLKVYESAENQDVLPGVLQVYWLIVSREETSFEVVY